MENTFENISKTTARLVQIGVSLLVAATLVIWAWHTAGSVLGALLLFMLGLLLVAPLLAWVLPVIALLVGAVAGGMACLFTRRSRP